MGTNTISDILDGKTAKSSDVNQFKTALVQDVVPRNVSGAPADIGGSVGSSVYRWLNGFFKKIYIGESASNNSIEDDSGDIVFKRSGVEKMRIGATGISAENKYSVMMMMITTESTGSTWRTYNFTAPFDFTVIGFKCHTGVLTSTTGTYYADLANFKLNGVSQTTGTSTKTVSGSSSVIWFNARMTESTLGSSNDGYNTVMTLNGAFDVTSGDTLSIDYRNSSSSFPTTFEIIYK